MSRPAIGLTPARAGGIEQDFGQGAAAGPAPLQLDLKTERGLHPLQAFSVDDQSSKGARRGLPMGCHDDVDVRVGGVAVLGSHSGRQTAGAGVPSKLFHDRSGQLPQVEASSVLG